MSGKCNEVIYFFLQSTKWVRGVLNSLNWSNHYILSDFNYILWYYSLMSSEFNDQFNPKIGFQEAEPLKMG